MAYLPGEAWVAVGVVGAAGLTACLHVLALRAKRECDVHDLRVRTLELRAAYAKRLAEEAEGEVIEVEPEDIAGRIGPGAAAPPTHPAHPAVHAA
jgi:hypothetical protein